MAGGHWSPVKAALVYYFHKPNKALKEHQKIGFSSRVEEKRMIDNLQLTYDSFECSSEEKFSDSVFSSLQSYFFLPSFPQYMFYIHYFFKIRNKIYDSFLLN